MSGKVYLIGAGPGDYKLITVKGRECIEKADVIVYDYLADQKILRWAREDAEIIYAGKQANHHTMKQEEINALLVEKGLAGHTVARLKGGDPLVFGRGGEEALALKEAGIPFEFVPGVTSAIAAPAYAGIPVTHRAVATSFAVVTGHEDPTKEESGMNWEHLAKSVDTICFVMGVGNLPFITEKLMSYGRDGKTPAAVIRWGTKAEQEVLVSTLDSIAEDVAKAGIKPPAIFMVGDVVELRESLQWFDQKPLFGKKIVVTRAREQASQLVDTLESLGADVIESPAIETIPLPLDEEKVSIFREIEDFNTIVFTSARGVEYFFERLFEMGLDSRSLGHMRFCVVGSGTAKALKKAGFLCDMMPEDYKAESLVETMRPFLSKEDRILLVQPLVARSVIPDALREMGIPITVLRLYKTEAVTAGKAHLIESLETRKVDYITFTSSSTVLNTLKMLGDKGKELLSSTKVICIGPITAATCEEKGIAVSSIAKEYTIASMVETIVEDALK